MITNAQRIKLMAELWPDACAQQGWSVKDDARRYAIFAELLGHWPDHQRTLAEGKNISCNHFIKTADRDDFGAVKARLLTLAANDLREDDPVRKTRLWIIQSRLMPCYRLYRAGTALATIMHERFKRVAGLNGVEDLSTSDLEKLIFTLEARVHAARMEKGHSKHEMAQLAGVACWRPGKSNCPECQRTTPQVARSLSIVEQPF